jgi:hypothetical protein
MTSAAFDDEAPTGAAVSAYDIAHAALYVRLLDAEAAGLDWRTIAAQLFAIDAARERERARRVVESHAARARWMRDEGYKGLLGQRPPS